MISHQHVPLQCYIITLNASMLPARLSDNLTCHPFVCSSITDSMFQLVSTRVQENLRMGVSLWGADFTNNVSLSIAYNHVQLWRHLAAATTASNMLVFEDNIVLNERPLMLYSKVQRIGVLPASNYILKFVNLQRVHHFRLGDSSFKLQKCTCRTRQSFFSSAVYVLDQHAARVLLQHHLPMQHHVNVFMRYVGCRYSSLFMFYKDVLSFSGRFSSHQTQQDHQNRFLANVKETIKNFFYMTCRISLIASSHI